MTRWRFGAVLALALAGPAGPALAQASDVVCNKCVNASDIDIGAVTTGRLSDNAVSAPKLRNLAVTAAKLQDGAVTTAKLQNGAVTAAKLAPSVPLPLTVVDDNSVVVGTFFPTTSTIFERGGVIYQVSVTRAALNGNVVMFWETDDCTAGPFITRTPDLALLTHKFNDLIYTYVDANAAAAAKTLRASSELNGSNCFDEDDAAAMGWDAMVLFDASTEFTAPFSVQ